MIKWLEDSTGTHTIECEPPIISWNLILFCFLAFRTNIVVIIYRPSIMAPQEQIPVVRRLAWHLLATLRAVRYRPYRQYIWKSQM